jgi:hypothetical protein
MKPGVGLAVVLAMSGLADAARAQEQPVTRGDQTSKPTTTTSSAPSRTTTTRTAPSTRPVDPGGLSGIPSSGSPTSAGPSYGPAGPGGTRTTRPRRSADPPPDTGGDIPYVDPPAAPGYESAADAGPVKTAGGKPPPGPAAHSPAMPSASAPPDSPATGAQPGSVVAPPPPIKPENGTVPQATPPLPGLPGNTLWIALAGLAAMLLAAGLGLRHILTAPHLSFRVTVDHGVQSAPRFKGAAS